MDEVAEALELIIISSLFTLFSPLIHPYPIHSHLLFPPSSPRPQTNKQIPIPVTVHRDTQEIVLANFWRYLKPGGMYIIEDVDAQKGGKFDMIHLS